MLRGRIGWTGSKTLASNYADRQALFLKLLSLPGATAHTVLDDVRWAWDADPADPLYVDRLQLVQSNGVYPDREARLVRFNATLLVKAFPSLRGQFAAIQELRPMRFEGKLPSRPRPSLSVVQASP